MRSPQAKQKTVLAFGTFDYLHPGHCNFFQQAKKLGRLIVIVARDKNVKKIKNLRPHKNERSRLATVAIDPNVCKALLGDQTDFLKPILKIKPDIIVLGFDQKTFSIPSLQTKLKKHNLMPKIIRLKSYKPQEFKSSLLRKKARTNF